MGFRSECVHPSHCSSTDTPRAEFIFADSGAYWTSEDGVAWTSTPADSARGLDGWFNGQYLTLGWPATISVSRILRTGSRSSPQEAPAWRS